jgi:hypothetical protein
LTALDLADKLGSEATGENITYKRNPSKQEPDERRLVFTPLALARDASGNPSLATRPCNRSVLHKKQKCATLYSLVGAIPRAARLAAR